VPRYLGTLAGCTSACPRAAVFPHSRPHKPMGHQLGGSVGPGVAKAVEVAKTLLLKCVVMNVQGCGVDVSQ